MVFKYIIIKKLIITILASQLSRILAVIYKLRNKINKLSLLLLYNSLFHSRLNILCCLLGVEF